MLEKVSQTGEKISERVNTDIASAFDQAKDLARAIDAFIFGNSLLKKLAPEQIDMCKQAAILFGLNPLKKEIHFVPRKNQSGGYDVTIVVGYEVYPDRAEDTGRGLLFV